MIDVLLTVVWLQVWNEPGCQRDLTCDEKLNMLQNWVPVVKSVNSVEVGFYLLLLLTTLLLLLLLLLLTLES